METQLTRRLPGVFFQTQPAALPEVLPRMDIAAFIGLAACGPMNAPVLIEDFARFREIFGGELPLAWDAQAGAMQTAYLGAAVEAFFRNGGRRCWVARVGQDARTHRFVLPGILQTDGASPAIVRARCPGSWAEALRAGAVLERQPLGLLDHDLAGRRLYLQATAARLGEGDLLRVSFPALSGGEAALACYLFLEDMATGRFTLSDGIPRLAQQAGGRVYWLSSQPGVSDFTLLEENDGLAQSAAWLAAHAGTPPILERLSFQIVAWQEEELIAQIGGLGFCRAHARFWGSLPNDGMLFRASPGRAQRPWTALEREASGDGALPRFPLAGPPAPALQGADYLPLGMALTPDRAAARGPVGDLNPARRLERDGLAGFSADLFVDPDLADVGRLTLLAEANQKYYLNQKPLRGLHSLLPLEEVTLVALPDAALRGWEERISDLPVVTPAPSLALSRPGEATDIYRLGWSEVDAATEYQAQESSSPDFRPAAVLYTGEGTRFRMLRQSDCPQRLYYRVRALRGTQPGPWSNTVILEIAPDVFEDCDRLVIPYLHLSFPAQAEDGAVTLEWQADPPEALAAVEALLEASPDPGFLAAKTLYQGAGASYTFTPPAERGVLYYRVRVESPQIGPWSNTMWLLPRPRRSMEMIAPQEYRDGDLLAVQRALLRFCAARGDIVAVLGMPAHYRQEQALAHLAALKPGDGDDDYDFTGSGEVRVPGLTPGEEDVLSYGAMYHPWLYTRQAEAVRESAESAGVLRLLPPEGAATGMIARRALERGAWVAPANVALPGVAALAPAFTPAEWSRLFAAQLNLARQEPRGFMFLSADTLSADPDYQPLNVRRLMILLRRLALREGAAYVFQPHDRALQRLLQHRFEIFLGDLFQRGAFAGRTPESSFRVVSDRTVNPPASVDQGRFIIEIRVAPSQPMSFLTVRLVQTGQTGLVVQEV